MVTLSSCLIWPIMSFILPPNEGLGSTYRICRFWQKNHLFRWSSFWYWYDIVCKEAKLSHLGCRKPLRIHWKTDTPKMSDCLVRIFVQRHNWAIFLWKWASCRPLQSMAIVIGLCWTNFCSQKLKRTILATFGFNKTAICDTLPKLHSMFCTLFFKIAL